MNRNYINSLLFTVLIFSCGAPSNKPEDQNFQSLKSLVGQMEDELSLLDSEIIYVKDQFEFFLEKKDSLLPLADRDRYQFDGAFSLNTPKESDSLSTLVIFENPKSTVNPMEEIYLSNGLDSIFGRIFKKYDFLAQIYSNSIGQVSRVYPAYDAEILLDKTLDVTNFNFFYQGDLSNNPDKGSVWIPDVYVDPAGRGWILSLIQPVYEGENLYAVLGMDITVDQILTRYLQNQSRDYLIVNSKGDIVAGKAAAIEALSFPPLRNHVYRETIESDNFRISDFNLFSSKNREVREMGNEILLKKESSFRFRDDFSPERAYAYPFTMLDWHLIEIHSGI